MAVSTHRDRGGGTLRLLGERVLRHSGAYLGGTAIELGLTMVRLAILTRLLPIGEFGQLALTLVFAGFIAIGCRLLAVTGTVLSVFRGGDEEGLEDEDPSKDADAPTDTQQRRILGTGIAMCLTISLLLAAIATVAWRPLDAVLIDAGEPLPIVLATILGGLQATWFLSSSISRYEKKPVRYISLQILQAALSIGLAVVLIEAGFGLDGAIAGTALGIAVALVPAIYLSRHRFKLAFDREHMLTIVKRGAPMIMITGSFFLFKNADIYVVSRYLPDTDVALYRVGSRIAALSTAGISALLLAWGPLARGAIRGAMTREGSIATAGARLGFYYWLVAVWIVVSLALLSSLLVKLAPSDYVDAQILIPLLGLAAALTSGVVIVHRTGQHRRKRPLFAAVGLMMFALVTGLCLTLIPAIGIYGTAAAIIAAPAAGLAVLLTASQRSEHPMPLPWGRIAATGAAGLLWVGLISGLGLLAGGAELAVHIAGVALFPFLLLVTGVVTRDESMVLLGLFRRVVPSPRNRNRLLPALEELDEPELELLDRMVRRREPVRAVAQDLDADETELMVRLVAVVRKLGGPRRTTPIEDEIGSYLLSRKNINDRDRDGHSLAMSEDLGPIELDQLDETIAMVRKVNARQWATLRS